MLVPGTKNEEQLKKSILVFIMMITYTYHTCIHTVYFLKHIHGHGKEAKFSYVISFLLAWVSNLTTARLQHARKLSEHVTI